MADKTVLVLSSLEQITVVHLFNNTLKLPIGGYKYTNVKGKVRQFFIDLSDAAKYDII